MSRSARRAQRSRRRVRITVVVAAVAIGLVVMGGLVVRLLTGPAGTSDDEPAALRTRPRSTEVVVTTLPGGSSAIAPDVTTLATSALAPEPERPPFAIDVARTTVVDPSRPTAARGSTPAVTSRTLPVTVYLPKAAGPFPLVVFAHGYDISAADYAELLRDLAAQGFVVAAPDFPRSSTVFAGPPTQADIDEQARDVAFLIGAFTDGAARGPWEGHIVAGEAGVVGHSDGGNTVARAASNSCCVTERIGAAAILAGDEGTSGGAWGVAGSPPMLFLQGTADSVNPFAWSQQLYDDAVSPKTLVAIVDGEHLAPFTSNGAQRSAVVALVADFLRAHLTKDAAALVRTTDLANRDGLRMTASS